MLPLNKHEHIFLDVLSTYRHSYFCPLFIIIVITLYHHSSEIEELHRMPVPGVTIVDYGGSPIVIEFLLRGPEDSLYAGTW